MSQTLLSIQRVSKHFGGITALNQVSFELGEGRIKGLIGPNGAGKTTLFNLVTGVYPVSEGEILFHGRSLNHLGSCRIAQRGIARTFQNVRLFSNLSVLENVLVGFHERMKTNFLSAAFHLPLTTREEKTSRDEAMKLLHFVGLAPMADQPATALPFGQQRLLEIARALATTPRLLLLDEPAAGLSIPERADLLNLIRAIRDQDITVLLVEHHMDLVMKVCDEIVVLEFGSKIAEGDPETVRNHPQVIVAYLGEEGMLADA